MHNLLLNLDMPKFYDKVFMMTYLKTSINADFESIIKKAS